MKIFSLFSGIGGFDLAAKRLGHTTIGACEIDRYARSIYSRHFPGIRIWEDATKISCEELPDFDMLTAGFPCQSFSSAGKRLGFEESRGTLFYEIVRIAKQKRPGLLLLENVRGLLSHDKGKTFAVILAALDELGYDAQWQVLNSKYFVPQNRERIFIVGYPRGEPRPKVFPVKSYDQGNNGTRYKTVPKGKQLPNKFAGTIDANYHKGGATRTMIYTSQSTNANMKKRIQKRDATWCLTTNSDSFAIIESEPILKQLNRPKIRPMERVYDSTGISKTILTNTGDGTGNYSINDKIRRLTPLECERLQGFPDDYTKFGCDGEKTSDAQRYRCLGNAVTVPVVEFIMRMIK